MRALVLSVFLLASPLAAKEKPLPGPPPVPRIIESKCTSPEHRQFDFWVGKWDVFRTGTKDMVAASTIEKLYYDCALRENWSPFSQIPGGSLTSYLPAEKLWKQTWVDSENARVDYTGSFSNGRMILTGLWKAAPGSAGKDRLSRMTFFPDKDHTVRQIGEYSLDGGKSWVPEYDFTYWPDDAK